MDERTKRLIEAVLDPRGKWYGRSWFDGRLPAVPDVMLMPAEDDDASVEAEADLEPWLLEQAASALDEWEPA